MSDLKPCPICGGVAEVLACATGGYYINCSVCGIGTRLHYGDLDDPNFHDMWNNRTPLIKEYENDN